jgi:hypothetical protein
MLVQSLPKEINSIIVNDIPLSPCFKTLEEVNSVITSLACVNKSWNLYINNSEKTLSSIKKLSKRFDVSNMEIAKKLSTAGAQFRYLVQESARLRGGTQFKSLPACPLDLDFIYENKFTMLLEDIYFQKPDNNRIRWLIKNGADINITGPDGKNALMYALYFFRENLIPLFLEHQNFDIHHRDKDGNTALHCCFGYGIRTHGYYNGLATEFNPISCAQMCPIIKELLKKGANPDLSNEHGETAFNLAAKTCYEPFLTILGSYQD